MGACASSVLLGLDVHIPGIMELENILVLGQLIGLLQQRSLPATGALDGLHAPLLLPGDHLQQVIIIDLLLEVLGDLDVGLAKVRMVDHLDVLVVLAEADAHTVDAQVTVGAEELLLEGALPLLHEPGLLAREVVVLHEEDEVTEIHAQVFVLENFDLLGHVLDAEVVQDYSYIMNELKLAVEHVVLGPVYLAAYLVYYHPDHWVVHNEVVEYSNNQLRVFEIHL